jgi:O-antigen/teichoic acid export membrane protein
MIYWAICKRKYQECSFRFYWNKELFKEITSYTGWNLFGAFAAIFKNQAVNILLNQFFNPLVIAARGIASMVNAAAVSLSQNFSTAIRPRIIKSYAAENKSEMLSLVFRGTRHSFFLMYIFILPLILEMPNMLFLWLKNPPKNAVLFTRLVLIDALIDSMNHSIWAAVQASGKIKAYQSIIGSVFLLILPLSWIALLMGAPAYSVMMIAIILSCIAFVIRLFIVKLSINYSIVQFFKEVIVPIGIVLILSMILPIAVIIIFFYDSTKLSLIRFFIVVPISIISCLLAICLCGIDKKERLYIISYLKQKFSYA